MTPWTLIATATNPSSVTSGIEIWTLVIALLALIGPKGPRPAVCSQGHLGATRALVSGGRTVHTHQDH